MQWWRISHRKKSVRQICVISAKFRESFKISNEQRNLVFATCEKQRFKRLRFLRKNLRKCRKPFEFARFPTAKILVRWIGVEKFTHLRRPEIFSTSTSIDSRSSNHTGLLINFRATILTRSNMRNTGSANQPLPRAPFAFHTRRVSKRHRPWPTLLLRVHTLVELVWRLDGTGQPQG